VRIFVHQQAGIGIEPRKTSPSKAKESAPALST
jgi:hypothetical protein